MLSEEREGSPLPPDASAKGDSGDEVAVQVRYTALPNLLPGCLSESDAASCFAPFDCTSPDSLPAVQWAMPSYLLFLLLEA